MAELLEVYNLNNKLIKIQERKKFYLEIKRELREKGKITKKVKTIRLLLMNSAGKIYLQKRSKIKNANPGLYDKTIAGHVVAGNTYNMTAIKECAEELGIPSAILSEEEFKKIIKVTDLNIIGIF